MSSSVYAQAKLLEVLQAPRYGVGGRVGSGFVTPPFVQTLTSYRTRCSPSQIVGNPRPPSPPPNHNSNATPEIPLNVLSWT